MDPSDIAFAPEATASRNLGRAVRRGLAGRCPHCGEGRLFGRFLKVRDHCACCGEALHHHRSDDAPPYVTLLIVCHVFGLVYVGVMSLWDMPFAVEMVVWPALVLALCLVLLPRVKGALVALQWALRMHGFADGDDRSASSPHPSA